MATTRAVVQASFRIENKGATQVPLKKVWSRVQLDRLNKIVLSYILMYFYLLRVISSIHSKCYLY